MIEKIHVKRTKAFKVICTSIEIQIDQEELQTVLNAIESGQPAVLKKGIFNPSYFIGVVEDVDRMKDYRNDIDRKNMRAIEHGMIKLKDIYPDDSTLKQALQAREERYIQENIDDPDVVYKPALPSAE